MESEIFESIRALWKRKSLWLGITFISGSIFSSLFYFYLKNAPEKWIVDLSIAKNSANIQLSSRQLVQEVLKNNSYRRILESKINGKIEDFVDNETSFDSLEITLLLPTNEATSEIQTNLKNGLEDIHNKYDKEYVQVMKNLNDKLFTVKENQGKVVYKLFLLAEKYDPQIRNLVKAYEVEYADFQSKTLGPIFVIAAAIRDDEPQKQLLIKEYYNLQEMGKSISEKTKSMNKYFNVDQMITGDFLPPEIKQIEKYEDLRSLRSRLIYTTLLSFIFSFFLGLLIAYATNAIVMQSANKN